MQRLRRVKKAYPTPEHICDERLRLHADGNVNALGFKCSENGI